MYKIYATDTFREIYQTLDKSEQDWINKTKDNLKEFPTGKPLGYRWFKEKKYLNKRLFFLIDEESKKVLLVSFASKKDQQKVIEEINNNLKEIKNLLKKKK